MGSSFILGITNPFLIIFLGGTSLCSVNVLSLFFFPAVDVFSSPGFVANFLVLREPVSISSVYLGK